jgi:hypothetical protein
LEDCSVLAAVVEELDDLTTVVSPPSARAKSELHRLSASMALLRLHGALSPLPSHRSPTPASSRVPLLASYALAYVGKG